MYVFGPVQIAVTDDQACDPTMHVPPAHVRPASHFPSGTGSPKV
jgi:hypothetical protein